ncbi:MAG: DegV family protein [Candidatus Izemoplasmataceae bacterium]
MGKIGIIVCGNSGIDYLDHPYDIDVFRSILLIREEEYTDYIDITAEDFYKRLKSEKDLVATTAQTATGVMVETIENMLKKGYEEILIITISSMLSGTYSGAVMAANMIDHDHIHVFDSRSVSYPEARMALDAAEMAARGKSIEEIMAHLEFVRDHHGIYFSVDTLKYLVKNGRLSGASGFVGALLKIKPLLMLTKDGRVESIEKIRTSSKSLNRVVEKFIEDTEGKEVEAFIIHAQADDRVKEIQKELNKRRPTLGDLAIYPLTPVVGAHAGPGVVALGFVEKK